MLLRGSESLFGWLAPPVRTTMPVVLSNASGSSTPVPNVRSRRGSPASWRVRLSGAGKAMNQELSREGPTT